MKSFNVEIDSRGSHPARGSSLGTAALTAIAPLIWGTTYLAITELLPPGRPFFLAAARVLPAGVILILAGALLSPWRPRGAEWARLTLLSLFNCSLFFPLLIVAVYRLPGGVAAAIGGLQPLLVGGLTWIMGGPRPRRLDLGVGLAAACGVGLVVLRPEAAYDGLGVLAGVGANLSFAIGVVLTKRSSPPPNRLSSTGWQLILSGALLGPLAYLLEGPPPALSGLHWIGLAYLGPVATGAAFALWFRGIEGLPSAGPPLIGLAAPVTGAALGWLFLNQSLGASQLLGFALVCGAVAYGALLPSEAAPHVSAPPSDVPALEPRCPTT